VNSRKTLAECMHEQDLTLQSLLHRSGLQKKVVEAIVHDRYTPSPEQRQRLAAALGVTVADIAWGNRQQVEHIYGHGPQFGRSP